MWQAEQTATTRRGHAWRPLILAAILAGAIVQHLFVPAPPSGSGAQLARPLPSAHAVR